MRKNYGGVGFTYDASKDAFIPPKPFASWTLNESTCRWDAPITRPTDEGVDGKYYWWNLPYNIQSLSNHCKGSGSTALVPNL